MDESRSYSAYRPAADLLLRSSSAQLPALEALGTLSVLWRNLSQPWGPTGSMGFELASGRATVTASSDLDIQIRADQPLTRVEARRLLEDTVNLSTSVDVVVETPFGGFALEEYAMSSTCMLRTPNGPVLTAQPWLNTLKTTWNAA